MINEIILLLIPIFIVLLFEPLYNMINSMRHGGDWTKYINQILGIGIIIAIIFLILI